MRLTVEAMDDLLARDREAAIERLKAGIASMGFFSEGRLARRDELHER